MNTALSTLEPTTLTEAKGVAEIFAASGLFKDAGDMARAFVKIMAGRELGFGAFASMNGINIIQGKPAIGSGLMAAAVKGHPRYDYQIDRLDDTGCELSFYEWRDGEWVPLGASSFVEDDAKKAQLFGKDNWKKNPRNMYFARAISNGLRWFCPDVFMQTVYVPEEMGADHITEPSFDPETGEVYEGEIVEPEPRRVAHDSPQPGAKDRPQQSELDKHFGPRSEQAPVTREERCTADAPADRDAERETPPAATSIVDARSLAQKTFPFATSLKNISWKKFMNDFPEWPKRFWPAAESIGLDRFMVHEALGVESVKEWAGPGKKNTVGHLWMILVDAAVESDLLPKADAS
jgi:hypothetical protein